MYAASWTLHLEKFFKATTTERYFSRLRPSFSCFQGLLGPNLGKFCWIVPDRFLLLFSILPFPACFPGLAKETFLTVFITVESDHSAYSDLFKRVLKLHFSSILMYWLCLDSWRRPPNALDEFACRHYPFSTF